MCWNPATSGCVLPHLKTRELQIGLSLRLGTLSFESSLLRLNLSILGQLLAMCSGLGHCTTQSYGSTHPQPPVLQHRLMAPHTSEQNVAIMLV